MKRDVSAVTVDGSSLQGIDEETGERIQATGVFHQGQFMVGNGAFYGTIQNGPQDLCGHDVSISITGERGKLELRSAIC